MKKTIIEIKLSNFCADKIKDNLNKEKCIIYLIGMLLIVLLGQIIKLPDWDIYLSILMPTLTFLTSGIITGKLIKSYIHKDINLYFYLMLWLILFEFNVDLVYVLYNQTMHHIYFRIPNYIGSSILYLLCCGIFSYKKVEL